MQPKVTQPCYADDAGADGTFNHLHAHMDDILAWGPPKGYLPDPRKSILAISTHNVAREYHFFHRRGLNIVTGIQYLGVYIAMQDPMQHVWGRR